MSPIKPKIWFTGDTHFSSERVMTLSRRPFTATQQMNTRLIKNWNDHVAPNDIVYHIGDFGNYKLSRALNGSINLLLGNYERRDLDEHKITLHQLRTNFNFKHVFATDKITVLIDGQVIELVHEPSHRDAHTFTLFGHIHGLQTVKPNALNVGTDCHHFMPIDFETVLFYKKSIQTVYDNEVFML